MKKLLVILLSLGLCHEIALGQTSAGGTLTNDSVAMTWSLGELAVANFSLGFPNLSQGVVQPYGVPFAKPAALRTADSPALLDFAPQKVFPNPFARYTMIRLAKGSTQKNVVAWVYTLQGQRAWAVNKPATQHLLRLDLGHLPPGPYVLVWKEAGRKHRAVIIKK